MLLHRTKKAMNKESATKPQSKSRKSSKYSSVSAVPTMMIAPDDYVHIYHFDPKNKIKKFCTSSSNRATKKPSSQRASYQKSHSNYKTCTSRNEYSKTLSNSKKSHSADLNSKKESDSRELKIIYPSGGADNETFPESIMKVLNNYFKRISETAHYTHKCDRFCKCKAKSAKNSKSKSTSKASNCKNSKSKK